MSEFSQTGEERLLADRLRTEAEGSRPEFSESLHERVCRAVAASRVSPSVPSRRTVRGWIVAAVAAAVVAVLAAPLAVRQVGEYFGGSDRVAIVPPVTPLPVAESVISWEVVDELADSTREDLGELFEVELNHQQWAGLDHDAQLALETLTRQLPFDVATALAASEP